MKKITGLLIALLLILFLSGCIENISEPKPFDADLTLNVQIIKEGDLRIFKIDRYSTTVVKIPHISSYLYLQRPDKSLEQIAADSSYTLVVNASYFDTFFDDPSTSTGRNYKQAGYLKINNSVQGEIKDDRQLSRLFAYNSKYNLVNYFSADELNKTKYYDLVFQTGPQIIWKNEIDSAGIDSSINGNFIRRRTAFASVNGNEFYIITALNFCTLKDLAKMLQSTGIFKKELNIINFDGGESTSLYIKNHPELSYFPDRKLPLLMCVK